MVQKYDVVVVGAGPAGSMAAMKAAEGGAHTLLVEKQRLPRFKLCGGNVANWVVLKLNIPRNVLDRKYTSITFCTPPKYEKQTFPVPGAYWGVYRDRFDYHLAKMAVGAGAELKEGVHVNDVIVEGRSVKGVVTNEGEKIFADVVIACDGVYSRIAKKCGFWDKWFKERGETWLDNMGFCMGVEMEMDNDTIEERFGDSYVIFTGKDIAPLGYGWIFPKEGMLSVGVGSAAGMMNRKPSEYLEYFMRHPAAAQFLEGGSVILSRGAFVPYRRFFTPSYSSGILVAGDAAGMVSPVTGEGIFFAVRAGMDAGITAAEAVQSRDFSAAFLSKYEERWMNSIGHNLVFQSQVFEETIGKILKMEDKLVQEEQYEKGVIEAFLKYIAYVAEYSTRKSKKTT
ncbi:MAG: NAD(P)/FAD-dependent oxidoreductase [Candidatus Freyarchaeota archaeon]|nr:NAD(P)/FAD-dependent oxidoreductase [Candidatus Jordarchaeia archaeon]